MPGRRLLPWLVPLLCVACSGAGLHPPERPEREHVFYVPKAEALEEARVLLSGLGFQLLPTQDPDVLLTSWLKPDKRVNGERETWRYAVMALEPKPGRTVVRILRVKNVTILNDVELIKNSRDKFRADWDYYDRSDHPASYSRHEQLRGRFGIGSNPIPRSRSDFGTRDLVLEKQLLERIESPPSLELPVLATGPLLPLPPPPTQGWLATWPDEADAAALDPEHPCGDAVPGLAPLLQPGHALLLGDQPGSREIPHAAVRIACHGARAGLPTTLALSLPHAEQGRLEAYVTSEGTAADQAQLLEGAVWRRPQQDGRASRAVLGALEEVRRLRAAGLPLRVLAIDATGAGGALRQEALAASVRERRQGSPRELIVVLAGNAHVRTREGDVPGAEGVVPMGALLARAGEPVTALDVAHARGTRWLCRLTVAGEVRCGPRVVSPSERATAPEAASLAVALTPPARGFDGLLTVGRLTASPPAVLRP